MHGHRSAFLLCPRQGKARSHGHGGKEASRLRIAETFVAFAGELPADTQPHTGARTRRGRVFFAPGTGRFGIFVAPRPTRPGSPAPT